MSFSLHTCWCNQCYDKAKSHSSNSLSSASHRLNFTLYHNESKSHSSKSSHNETPESHRLNFTLYHNESKSHSSKSLSPASPKLASSQSHSHLQHLLASHPHLRTLSISQKNLSLFSTFLFTNSTPHVII